MVAPLAGVWIETLHIAKESGGLYVAPLAGVWIETSLVRSEPVMMLRRSPCGSVD
jgi:hypothetical protein